MDTESAISDPIEEPAQGAGSDAMAAIGFLLAGVGLITLLLA